MKAQQIRTKSISDSTDISQTIIEEARDGGYETVLVGGAIMLRGTVGSVSGRIVSQGNGLAVTVTG